MTMANITFLGTLRDKALRSAPELERLGHFYLKEQPCSVIEM